VSIRRQSFGDEPTALALDERFHLVAAVRHEAVPDHRRLLPTEVLAKLGEKDDERVIVV